MRRAFRPLRFAAARPPRPAQFWLLSKGKQITARHGSTLSEAEAEPPRSPPRKHTASTYAALLDRNTDAELGSAAKVAALFDDMARDGIEPDSAVCHAAVRALAAHPDPILLSSVLAMMRDKWLYLDEVARHDIAAGQIKNGQLEEALEGIDEMQAGGVPVRPWLLDMAIFALCDRLDVDGALHILQSRVRTDERAISRAAWYQAFDTACSVLHYDGIAFIWQHQVELHYLNPSSGQCLAVLHAAARCADTALASSVFRLLNTRTTATQLWSIHYELLIDAYLHANDVRTVLNILCIMNETGLIPNRSTTRALYTTLISHGPERVREAFDMLCELKEERPDRVIPTAIMDAILEATLYNEEAREARQTATPVNAASTAKPQLDLAFQRYKEIPRLCSNGPTIDTFNTLLSSCVVLPGSKGRAMFLAQEMLTHGVEPNAATYDHLLQVCLSDAARLRTLLSSTDLGADVAQRTSATAQASFDDAFSYYREMHGRGWTPRLGTFERMVKACCAVQDPRAWILVERMREANIDNARIREWLSDNWAAMVPASHAQRPDGDIEGIRDIA